MLTIASIQSKDFQNLLWCRKLCVETWENINYFCRWRCQSWCKYYKDHLLAVLVPDMSNLAGNDHSMCLYKMPQELIQSKKTLEYLNKNFPDYIKPSSWPPTVPTLILWIILFKAKKQCFQQKKLSILNSWKREFNWVLGRIPPRRDWQGNWFIQSSP